MNKLIPILFTLIITSVIFFPTISISNGNGSPGGKTGSIGDGNISCTACHYAGIGNGATISTNIPVSGYIPGQTYTVTATIQDMNINKFGFELTAEDNSGDKQGTFIITNASETKLTNGGNAVTHKGTGTNGQGVKTWIFDWIAPNNLSGKVTFWGSFLAANGDFTNMGDAYHFDTTSVNEGQTNNIFEQKNYFNIINNNIYTDRNILEIVIYDLSGKIIKKYTNIKQHETLKIEVLNTGIYVISATDFNSYRTMKKIFLL